MKNIEKVNLFFYKTTCGIMLFFFGLIFLQTTQNVTHMDVLGAQLTGIRRPLFLLSGALLLLGLVFLLTGFLKKRSGKTRTVTLLILAFLGICLQVFLILWLRPCLQYDALKPVDTAIAMLGGTPLAATEYYRYFSFYPHNVPLTLYIMCIFKIAGFLGIAESNYIVLLQLINCVLLDLALFTMYSMIKRYYGSEKGLFFGILCLLHPLIYYYPVFFYTQVLSIPLFVLLITEFFKLVHAKTTKGRILHSIVFGIALFFGWKIRFFTLITLIAAALFLWFRKNEQKRNLKTLFCMLAGVLLSFMLCVGINELLETKYTIHTEETQAFPVQHWIMMGLQGDGTFSYLDEDFTSAFPGKDSRAEKNVEIIKQRLKSLGISGLLNLWNQKLAITWSDGYDDYSSNLTLVDHYDGFYDLICGEDSEPLTAYLHIYNCMLWLLLTLCAVKLLRRTHADFIYTVSVTLLGGILFHLIWEAGEPYSMPFILLMIGGASVGFEGIGSFQNRLPIRGLPLKAVTCSALLFLGTIISVMPSLAAAEHPTEKIASIQNLVGGNFLTLEAGDTITQTVTASRSFNTLTLRYQYAAESGEEGLVSLRFYDENGTCLTEQSLPVQGAVTVTDFLIPAVDPAGSKTYTIELCAKQASPDTLVTVTCYNTGNWDVYTHGSASKNGNEIPKGDLYFSLSNR